MSQLWKGRSSKAWQVLWNWNEKYHLRIKEIINWVDHAFNSIEITNYANFELNKNYKPYFIRKLMKSELNLTLKKLSQDLTMLILIS